MKPFCRIRSCPKRIGFIRKRRSAKAVAEFVVDGKNIRPLHQLQYSRIEPRQDTALSCRSSRCIILIKQNVSGKGKGDRTVFLRKLQKLLFLLLCFRFCQRIFLHLQHRGKIRISEKDLFRIRPVTKKSLPGIDCCLLHSKRARFFLKNAKNRRLQGQKPCTDG